MRREGRQQKDKTVNWKGTEQLISRVYREDDLWILEKM